MVWLLNGFAWLRYKNGKYTTPSLYIQIFLNHCVCDRTSDFLKSSSIKMKAERGYPVRFILFGVLRRFQHCTGHITTGSRKGRGNQYIQFVRVLYCKLPTNGKQLPAFPLEAMLGIEPRPQRWEARVLPLCHRGPRYPVGRKASTKWCPYLFFTQIHNLNQ